MLTDTAPLQDQAAHFHSSSKSLNMEVKRHLARVQNKTLTTFSFALLDLAALLN